MATMLLALLFCGDRHSEQGFDRVRDDPACTIQAIPIFAISGIARKGHSLIPRESLPADLQPAGAFISDKTPACSGAADRMAVEWANYDFSREPSCWSKYLNLG